MARPRALTVLGALGALAACVAFLRRGGGGRRERVDLYFDDGSMLSLADGTPEAATLLGHARDALRA